MLSLPAIRWQNAIRAGAIVGAAGVTVALAPALLRKPDPPALAADVGLPHPPPVQVTRPARPVRLRPKRHEQEAPKPHPKPPSRAPQPRSRGPHDAPAPPSAPH